MESEPKKEAPPKYTEGQILSRKHTLYGPVSVVWRNGQQVVEEIKPIPGDTEHVRPKDLLALASFLILREHAANQEGRSIPLLLTEVQEILGSRAKILQRKGILEIKTLQMKHMDGNVHSRSFCWLTGFGQYVTDITEEALRQGPEPAEVSADGALVVS